MISISFTFSTKDIEYAVISGSKASPSLHSKGKVALPKNVQIPETVCWFEKELHDLLLEIKPDVVSYRLTLNNVTNNYVFNVYYAQAILNLLCAKNGLNITHLSPASIKPGKFNLPKETKLVDYIEQLVGKQPSPWDKGMKNTVLSALMYLP